MCSHQAGDGSAPMCAAETSRKAVKIPGHHLHDKTAAGLVGQPRQRPQSGGAVLGQGTWLACARLRVPSPWST